MTNWFVYLKEQNCSINLAHITFVEWDVEAKDEQGQVSRVTTVSMSGGGGFFLGERDSWTLRKAIQDYSKREQAAGEALPALNRIYDALLWLARTGFDPPTEVNVSEVSTGTGKSNPAHETDMIAKEKAKREQIGVTN